MPLEPLPSTPVLTSSLFQLWVFHFLSPKFLSLPAGHTWATLCILVTFLPSVHLSGNPQLVWFLSSHSTSSPLLGLLHKGWTHLTSSQACFLLCASEITWVAFWEKRCSPNLRNQTTYTRAPENCLFFFLWPSPAARGILFPQPGIKLVFPAVEA